MAKTVDDFFEGKPETHKLFNTVKAHIGTADLSVGTQISFGTKRKFAWFWLYNVTQKDPNGVLHLMLAIDRKIDDPHVRSITQIGKNRWNHQIVIRTSADAGSAWLKKLVKEAVRYGKGE